MAKKIALSSETDPVVLTALQALDGEMPLPFRSKLIDWTYKGGILSYKDQVYVPNHLDLHRAAVAKHHDHPTTGHPGILKTCQLIATEFWWPGLLTFVRRYIEGCAICQQNKVNTHPLFPFRLQLLTSSNRSCVTSSPISPPPQDLIPYWSW